MTISGYTFVRNAIKLGYPLKESILSILDIVDEFVIVYCKSDEDDNTLEVINSIASDKIKIVEANWEPDKFKRNTLYSYLSDIGKHECQGDWLFYLQVDEVVHEQYLSMIKNACETYLMNRGVEGLLFNFRHFWGDFDHCFTHQGWYPREIRIIRNLPEIHSWRDAQSFRFYTKFEPTTEFYQSKEVARKLSVAEIPAAIYHYGWVRPPLTMSTKQDKMVETWQGDKTKLLIIDFDYGPLNRVPVFKGTHPKVMVNVMNKFFWKNDLQYSGLPKKTRNLHKHERLKYRIKSWIELNLLGGREIGGFKNYKIVAKFK
ncbi:MAG: hypothetical protein L3J29_05780 [Cyclobacteriaceae bacterium]|nr:hypothetical protein [Cyclobacteriaceae bacterium]